MPTESQPQYNDYFPLNCNVINPSGGVGEWEVRQDNPNSPFYPNGVITSLSFWLRRVGNPTGSVAFKLKGGTGVTLTYEIADAGTFSTNLTKVTLSGLSLSFDGALSKLAVRCINNTPVGNHIEVAYQNTDVKPTEYMQWAEGCGAGTIGDLLGYDLAYEYTYNSNAFKPRIFFV